MYHLTLTYYNNTNCSTFLTFIDNITGTCEFNQNKYECCDWMRNEKNITLNNCEESEIWTCSITTDNDDDIYHIVVVSMVVVLCVIFMSTLFCAIFNKHKSQSGYDPYYSLMNPKYPYQYINST